MAVSDTGEGGVADDPIGHGMRQVVERATALTRQLSELEVAAENVWFRNLLVGILNSALRDYRSVEIGVQKRPQLAAWGARNLLELRVITTYVLGSEANAFSFKDDFAADLKEFWEALKKAVSSHTTS